jgi:ribosomal protein L37E
MKAIRCAPEWPVRSDNHKDHRKLALQILRERHRNGESAAAILNAYSRPEEGLKLSTLKLFLKADHKGPVRDATRHAIVSAGRCAWARHCPLAVLHDLIAATLLGPTARNSMEQFYGRYRSLDRRQGKPHQVTNAPATIGPCSRCRRPLFHVKPREVWRCGFPFNVNSRLYVFLAERNYMRMAILRCPDVPGVAPLTGILLAEEKDPTVQVGAAKTALIPEGSPWYGRADLQERMSRLLVNQRAEAGFPDGTLVGWRSLPPPPDD